MIARKPTIVIYTAEADPGTLYEVCAGVEEEGVLFEVSARKTGSGMTAVRLSAEAAQASVLGSGVGICGRDLSLHIRGMEREGQVLAVENADAGAARDMGSNAARVIKKQPLRLRGNEN